MEIAKLNVGQLPLIVVDDLEHYDQEHLKEWIASETRSGLQFVGGLVSDENFHLKSFGAEVEEAVAE
jgi:hypothetical protein